MEFFETFKKKWEKQIPSAFKTLETSLVQALILSEGSVLPFFTRPISLFFVLLTVFFLIWSLLIQKRSLGRGISK